MNLLEKAGLLWVLYWFTQSAMHSSVYYTINSYGAYSNARAALILSVPGVILFLIGNYLYNKKIEKEMIVENPRICKRCGFENDTGFIYCSNCGNKPNK